MKKKYIIILVVLVVLIIGGIAVKLYWDNINADLKKLTEMPISNVDLSKVPDGAYDGSYEVFPITVEVKVVVKDHKISNIDLVKHKNGKGASAEIIPGKVVEAQSLNVDTVSGATYSSKVILKAIENALISSQT